MPNIWTCQGRLQGFDCNVPVGLDSARVFRKTGYKFVVRYVPRLIARSSDLTSKEITNLHLAGLGVMPVQHVESETAWIPSDQKAIEYGRNAAAYCNRIGIAKGTTLWLDLEGVDKATPTQQIIRYCNRWYDLVKAEGYQPGIYIGWHAGLNADELYQRLKFQHYWAAYNLNGDQYPAVRGVCMQQFASRSPSGVAFPIDSDQIFPDKLGGFPTLFVPDEWDPK